MISQHTILYAEDDIDDLFIVREAFEQHDHIEVVHAPNGSDALKLLNHMLAEKCLPCLVILDINMPVMDGREVLMQIKQSEKLKDIPVVLFSTSNSIKDRSFAEMYQTELIVKPVD